MERITHTGSTDEQTETQFYLPGSSTRTETSLAERFLTGLFRERGTLFARIRREE